MIKIFLAISTVANLILIASVVGVLPLLLALASIIVLLLLWYIRKLSTETKEMIQDFEDFYLKIENYEKHLEDIHGLEMFYGDQTLQGLIKHSRGILNDIYDFQSKYSIGEQNLEEEVDAEEDS